MGLLGLIGQQQRVQFVQKTTNTIIQFDCSIKEDHKRSSPATEFPLENGVNISDNIIVKPFKLTLTGVISDTPINGIQQILTEVATTVTSALLPPVGVVAGAAGYALFQALSGAQSPSAAAYAQLLLLQERAQPFNVITSLKIYQDMWISDLSVPRDADTGKALIFTVELMQLILVKPQSVNIAIFAQPALSANKADQGEQGANLSAQYQQGYSTANQAVLGVSPSGAVGSAH